MPSNFIEVMYILSKEPKVLDFFDKIKDTCENWIDTELKIPYKLSLDMEDRNDDPCLYIGFNKPDGETLSEEELDKEIEELERFEDKFVKHGKKKRLTCNYNDKGDFEIRNNY